MNNIFSATPSKDFSSYLHLQKSLDKVLGKIGVDNTIELLESFIDNTSLDTLHVKKIMLITQYIIAGSIDVFDIEQQYFYTSNVREYREARMATYHLLRKYTDFSYTKIGGLFNQKKRNIIYFCNKCTDILFLPQYNEVFADRYAILEKQIITYISKLN